MSIDEIKGALCKYFNDCERFSVQFIKSPTNSPAPVGCYVAVGIDSVEQYGHKLSPPPGKGKFLFSQVAMVHFVEVEGDGDILRKTRNELELPQFTEFARERGFTIWQPTAINAIDTYDGKFFIRQWRFSFQVNFTDEIAVERPRIETVKPLILQSN